ncbi:MAG: diguanylate cyclase, partial [Hyphomicrobiales bacterium]|nr:diguanylate cyclase [Hyphomicrobiales bacterium]
MRISTTGGLGWLVAAGVVTGFGTWATHFIAMLAYRPGFELNYDLVITACSLIASAVMTTAGFAIVLYRQSRQTAMLGGAVIGIGIACMHYTGMASLRIPAVIEWMPDLVAASIVGGMVLGALAMLVAQGADKPARLLFAALLLALAICVHHFLAMGAINLISRTGAAAADSLLSPIELSLAVAAFTVTVVLAGLVIAISDRRSRRSMRQRNMQLDAALNNMGQGLCMYDADGGLELWNDSYLRMYRIPPEMMVPGATMAEVVKSRGEVGMLFTDQDRYDAQLRAAIAERRPASQTAELPDGRIIHVRYRPMESGGWVVIHADITDRKFNEARIVHLARHDPVTDLPNRVAFNEYLQRVFAEASAGRGCFAVVRIDIDHFREINEIFGQAMGDAVLADVAKRLTVASNGAFLARPSGDIFSIVAQLGADPHAVDDLCARLSAVLDVTSQIERRDIRVRCSIGISLYPQDGNEIESLIAHADLALDRAKAEERGTIRFFEAEMDQQIREKRLMQRDLVVAIENEQFELHFQPQASAGGEILAFEVLLRWRHPERGLVSPA